MGDFFVPQSLKEAVEFKNRSKSAFYLAGGTMLNIWRKGGNSSLSFISLQDLNLKNIERRDGRIYIQAMVTDNELALYCEQEGIYPELQKACMAVGKNLRNVATVGGAVASRIIRSDLTPMFMALDGRVKMMTLDGEEKEQSINDFVYSPDRTALVYEISIKDDHELIVRSKRYSRNGNDNPVVKSVVSYHCVDGKILDLAIVVGGIDRKFIKAFPIEQLLEGKEVKNGYSTRKSMIDGLISEMNMPPTDLLGSGEFKKAIFAAQLEDIFLDMEESAA